MLKLVNRFIREDEGMEMLEWAIVAVVFAVALVGAWQFVFGLVNGKLRGITF